MCYYYLRLGQIPEQGNVTDFSEDWSFCTRRPQGGGTNVHLPGDDVLLDIYPPFEVSKVYPAGRVHRGEEHAADNPDRRLHGDDPQPDDILCPQEGRLRGLSGLS